jgi:GEVED domain-containing protein/putative BNR repeat neuraminidase
MKKIFSISLVTLFMVSMNLMSLAQDNSSKKKEFWEKYQIYKSNLDKNIATQKPVDPNGLFFIDEKNNFQIRTSSVPFGEVPNPNVPWIKEPSPDVVSSGFYFSQSTTTYTPAVGGTILCAGSTFCDDLTFTNIPLGFTFNYNGTAYTACGAICNGWILMGTGTPLNSYTPLSDASNFNVIAPFARDLLGYMGGTGSDTLRYLTTGIAPNRVFTIEWYHWGIYSTGNNEINFQIKLYETSNIIQFVYQPTVPTTSITDVQVGLKGAANTDFKNRTTTANWSATTEGTVNTATCYFNSSVYPANGLTFTWNPNPQFYNYATSVGSNAFPFGIAAGKRVQWLVRAGEFNQPSGATQGDITTVSFYMATTVSTTFTNLTIRMAQDTITTLPTGVLYTGPLTTVYTAASVPLASTAASWMHIPLQTFFTYDSTKSLIIEVSQCGATVAGMNVNQTTLTGFRRTYSDPVSCVFSYTGQDANVANCGITVVPTTAMVYVSSTTAQLLNGVPVPQASTNVQIIQVQVATSGSLLPRSATRLAFNTFGTTNPAADIATAKVYYTGLSSTFSTSTQFGSNVSGPNGAFSVTGSQQLANGTNYFWLVYDVPSGAPIWDYLDARCDTVVMNDSAGTHIPSITSPAGNRQIDNYARGQFSNAGNCCNLYISNVTFQSINNTTGFDPNGNFPYAYSSYPTPIPNIEQGSTYPISISEPGSSNANGFAVWIDWNNNNSFLDGGEYYNIGVLPSGGSATITGNIAVPPGAALGNHRMRVRNNFSTAPTAAQDAALLSYGETEDYLVNVVVATPMAYSSSTATQTVTTPVSPPATNAQIIGVQIVTTGTLSPIGVTSFTFNTNGSTNPATDISRARLFYTGTSPVFATTLQFGGYINSPSGSFQITGSQQLAQGTNYFWLTYDVPSTATMNDTLDAECNSMVVASITRTPTVQAPAGNRVIGANAMGGVYTIPGNYAHFSLAIADLNARGTYAPVTFNVQPGFIDTAVNLVITRSGTSANPIVFKNASSDNPLSSLSSGKDNPLVNPLIVAGTGTGTTDGIIKLSGADYITFDGIDLQENPANTTTTTWMEWGYALLKPDGTNGCQNVTIKNCVITLNKSNVNTLAAGIYSANHSPTSTGTFVVTTTAGANSNNLFLNNSISNSYNGYYLNGYADFTIPYTFYDQNNTINGGNITNYGGSATTAQGVFTIYQNGLTITNCSINSAGGTNSTGTLYGIFCSTMNNANLTISNNTVSVTSASTTSTCYGIHFGSGSSGTSNDISILNNTIQNCNYVSATSASMFYLQCNAICNNLTVSGNRIINNVYGTAAVSSGLVNYILNSSAATTSITLTNNLDSGNVVNGLSSYGQNYISSQVATFNVTITGNKVKNNIVCGTSAAGTSNGIINSGGNYTCNMNNNEVSGNILPTTSAHTMFNMSNTSPAGPTMNYTNNLVDNNTTSGSGTIYGIYYAGSPGAGSTMNINNNTVTNMSRTTATGIGTTYGINQSSSSAGTINVNNNTVTGFTSAAATTIYGIYQIGSPPNFVNINDNRVGNLSNGGVATIWGINNNPTSTSQSTMARDSIFNLSSPGGTIYGISIGSLGFKYNIFKNKISGINSNTSTTAVVYGFYSLVSTAGATINFYNNIISDINAPASTSIAPAVSGINIPSGVASDTLNIFYNTILLKAISSSVTTFSTAGIYALTTPIVNLRNNIVADSSTPGPTGGNSVAYRRSSTILTTYSNAANNNCLYAGTPSSNHLIYFDGTNSDQTLAAYKNRVVPRDNNSITEYPPFINSASPPYDLRIRTNVATGLESGAQIISSPISITDDGYGVPRYPNVGYPIGGFTPTAPDIGANEFGGLNADLAPPVITYTPLGNGGTANRSFANVTITDASGVNVAPNTRPRCYYKKSTNGNVFNDTTNLTDGWKSVQSNTTSSPYDFTIDYSRLFGGGGVIAGDVIQYFVIAQDLATTPNVGWNQGVFSATNPTSVNLYGSGLTMASTLTYTIVTNVFSGSYNVGTAQTYTSLTGAGGLFASINAGTVAGNITAVITSNLTEDGTNALNIFNETGVGGYRLRIVPDSAVVRVISGTVAQGMIRFNGSRRVTIDGGSFFVEQDRKIDLRGDNLVPGKYLTFRNTFGSQPTFVFINDAIGDSLKYCNIESNNTSTASGTIVFSTTTGVVGNDSNVIAFCDIRDRSDLAGTPANGIYSLGTTTSFPTYNSNNVITNCNIYNWFFNSATTMAGIFMTSGTTDWVITNNSFYQTVSRDASTTSTFVGVFSAATTANNMQVIGNYFGGTAPLCGGTPMTYTGAGLYTYNGIQLNIGVIAPSSIQGNTVQNIDLTTSPASSSSIFFRGITVPSAGYCNIGNITGNTIGSGTGNNSIKLTVNTTITAYTSLAAIFSASIGNISNNIMGSITVGGNAVATSAYQIFPLTWTSAVLGWTYTCNNNLIGSLSTPNSIQFTDSLSPCQIRGLFWGTGASGTTNNITNNTVANITNNAQATTANTAASVMYGVSLNSTLGNYNITGNTIFNLTLNSNVINLPSTFLTGGILGNNTGLSNISQNTISSVYYNASGAGLSPNVGMFLGGATGTTISRNKLWDLRWSSATTNASSVALSGIFISSTAPGILTVSNNMVTVTNGDPTDIPLSKMLTPEQIVHKDIPMQETQTVPVELLANKILPVWKDGITPAVEPDHAEPYDIGINKTQRKTENPQQNLSTLSASLAGIVTQFSSGGAPSNYLYNSVYVGGTQPGTSPYPSWAFLKQFTGALVLRDNLFVNARTGGAGPHYVIGNEASPPYGSWTSTTSNYNSLLGSDLNTIGEWGAGITQTMDQWRTSSGGDNQSWATSTATVVPTNLLTGISTGNLNIQSGNSAAWLVSGKGIALTGQSVDYNGNARVTAISGGCTDIGANEFAATPPSSPVATQVGTPGSGAVTTYSLYGRTLCSIQWGTGGTSYPTSMNVVYNSGVTPSPNVTSPNRSSNSNWVITIGSGTLAGAKYDITLNIGDNETFSITSPSTNTLLAKYSPGTFWSVYPAGSGQQQSNLNWSGLSVTAAGINNSFSTFALTDAALPACNLVSPANDTTVSTASPTLVWMRSAGSTTHHLQVATDSTFTTIVKDTTTSDTTKALTGLLNNTKYWWHIQATNGIGTGGYSQLFNFRVVTILPPAIVNLTVIPGGFYDGGTGRLRMKDTIRVYLVDSVSCLRMDSTRGVLDSATFSLPSASFSIAPTGNYYIFVYHRNHLAIASRFRQNVVRGSTVGYDFTTDSAKAYGFNMIKVSISPVRWGMIPGDANQDGFVDGLDQTIWIAQNGLDGYLSADFNGDTFVDGLDQTLWILMNGQSTFLPCGFALWSPTDRIKQQGDIQLKFLQQQNTNSKQSK